ncbi:hypothetical protein BKA80DRAFT_19532 [Phyllosticta citrichinensis]
MAAARRRMGGTHRWGESRSRRRRRGLSFLATGNSKGSESLCFALSGCCCCAGARTGTPTPREHAVCQALSGRVSRVCLSCAIHRVSMATASPQLCCASRGTPAPSPSLFDSGPLDAIRSPHTPFHVARATMTRVNMSLTGLQPNGPNRRHAKPSLATGSVHASLVIHGNRPIVFNCYRHVAKCATSLFWTL